MPRIAGNLLHLEGRPGLMPRYSPGMGVRGFPLTSALLPQNVRKNMRLQSLKGIKLYVIETQFLEPHILYVGLLDLVTIE